MCCFNKILFYFSWQFLKIKHLDMKKLLSSFAILSLPVLSFASEADLVIPDGVKGETLLYWGFLITFAGFLFGLYQFVSQFFLDGGHVPLEPE